MFLITVLNADTALVKALKRRKIRITQGHWGHSFRLEPNAQGLYKLPFISSRYNLKVGFVAEETGGGGIATIVTNGCGEKLRPFKLKTEENGAHAAFSVTACTKVVITSSGRLSIVRLSSAWEDGEVWTEGSEVFSGYPQEVPCAVFDTFSAAIAVAQNKAKMPRCIQAMYYTS